MKKFIALVLALLLLMSGTVCAEEKAAPEICDTVSAEGFRHVDMPLNVSGNCNPVLLLDASHLSAEDLLYAKLLAQSFPYIHTSSHTREELDSLSEEYLQHLNTGLSILEDGADGFHIYLRLSWYTQEEKLNQGYDLMFGLLFDADLDDTESVLTAVRALKEDLRSSILSSPYTLLIYRAAAISSLQMRVFNYVAYLDYYAFLEQAEAQLAESPEAFLAQLKRVRVLLANSFGAIAAFAGNEESIVQNARLSDSYLSILDSEPHEPADYSSLPVPAAREGLVINENIQYNLIAAGLETLGIEYTPDLDVLAELVKDKYLRGSLTGAYYIIHGFSDDMGMYIISYRDSEIRQSFEAMEQAGSFVAGLDVDQEEMDGYISSVAEYYSPVPVDDPNDKIYDAFSDIVDYLEGQDPQWKQQARERVEAATSESLRAYAPLYNTLGEKGIRSTAGNAEVLEQNSDLYDVILNPFNILPPGVFRDVPEDHPFAKDITEVVKAGIMTAEGDAFRPDEPVSLGDMAYGLCVLGIGVAPTDGAEAYATLVQFGLMLEGGDPETSLTYADLNAQIKKFMSAGYGIDLDETFSGNADTVTRAELAQIFNYIWIR